MACCAQEKAFFVNQNNLTLNSNLCSTAKEEADVFGICTKLPITSSRKVQSLTLNGEVGHGIIQLFVKPYTLCRAKLHIFPCRKGLQLKHYLVFLWDICIGHHKVHCYTYIKCTRKSSNLSVQCVLHSQSVGKNQPLLLTYIITSYNRHKSRYGLLNFVRFCLHCVHT